MSSAVVLILFFVCLLIAIPISVSLGIVSVLPGAFDPSFTASATYVIRSMFGGLDSFPLLAVPMFILSGIIMARGGISKRLFDLFAYFIGKKTAGPALRGRCNLPVLRGNFRFRDCYSCSSREYDHSSAGKLGI